MRISETAFVPGPWARPTILALALCLAGPASAADAAGPDEATRLKIAEYMLKTPLDEADPTLVSGFMKLDAAALPKKLRDKARAKQLQIGALVKIHDGKKKGALRSTDAACVPKRYGAEGVKIMAMIPGNSELEADEEEYLEKRSKCTEDQLICEFTLNVVVVPRKGMQPMRRYYMMESDPLMAWVAEYRARGGAAGPPKYFQAMKTSCQAR